MAEEQLRLLAESSPAAILTTDGRGVVLAANRAAETLFGIPPDQSVRGRNIMRYLPVLDGALQVDAAREGLRTAMQCQGNQENGEIFLARIWFSSYLSEEGPRLAAIVVDSSEEMREREEQGLQHLLRGNRIAATAVAHEVRNFCVAMNLLCGNLRRRETLAGDDDVAGLTKLLGGLQTIASIERRAKSQGEPGPLDLREGLDSLRIVIEPAWRDVDGDRVGTPADLTQVIAEPRGLLQAFLNPAQNTHRAVQEGSARELRISVSPDLGNWWCDSVIPVPALELRKTSSAVSGRGQGSGMGLYVSRFIVRTFGGELRYEPRRIRRVLCRRTAGVIKWAL